jgi:4-amino-4-deoxy-L-arabinose transferase-like glycosyltransferase
MRAVDARGARIAFLLILLVAFAVRMVRVADLQTWDDEGLSVVSASRDLYAITFEGKDVDPHPPLYYYLLYFYLPLAGASELAIRFFSIFFGTATFARVYTLGRKGDSTLLSGWAAPARQGNPSGGLSLPPSQAR